MTVPFTTEDSEESTRLANFFLKIVSVFPLFFLCVLCGFVTASCGRKGPPLPPLVRLPAPVTDLTAKRLGDHLVLQFTIPSTNTDASRPSDLDRIDVYAHTGQLPSAADFLKYGTLVGNVAVKSSTRPGAEQGSKASLSETITAAQLEPGLRPAVRNRPANVAAPQPVYTDVETEGTINLPTPTLRYYVAVGTSPRNRRGPYSAQIAFPLVEPLGAPTNLKSQYTQDEISLEWAAPSALEEGTVVTTPRYNVYETAADSPATIAGASETTSGAGSAVGTTASITTAAPNSPLNSSPLPNPAFTDDRIEFGARRCYLVRTVRVYGTASIESEPSPPECVTPVDTFPPAAPRALAAATSDEAVNLIWEPNTEKDLAGYLVLRGETAGETLTPLTPAPIQETTYRDSTARPGVSYDYVVVAVDNAAKPNISEYSNRVTEAVR